MIEIVPMFRLYFSKNRENKTLEKLRDSLLPKLMSGELDVSNIDI
jgi:type I restriction enzyme S subunit